MKKYSFLSIVLSFINIFAYAQEGKLGINTQLPDATLDIHISTNNLNKATNEGILIPRLDKERVALMPSPKESTIIYVNKYDNYTGNENKVSLINENGFYYFDTHIQKWRKIKTHQKLLDYENPDNILNLTCNEANLNKTYDSIEGVFKCLRYNNKYVFGYAGIWTYPSGSIGGVALGGDVLTLNTTGADKENGYLILKDNGGNEVSTLMSPQLSYFLNDSVIIKVLIYRD